ncbi:MAG: SUMF1/EgtB/PvdO family nonheme iron enzyme [Bacteroidales bacterium]|nr:SUMF1/EgtB/PvdO family nonheme iron enzyme [Bacteroidales bacterium]
MKKNGFFIVMILWTFVLAGCEKLMEYEEGRYLCENDELTRLEGYNGFYFHWAEEITPEQQEVIKNMVANMVRVNGGTFVMGRQSENPTGDHYDANAEENESPIHQVTLSDYYLAKYEVSQKEWETIMGEGTGWSSMYGYGDSYPAYNIRFVDAEAFVQKLGYLSGLDFRLPTEAEWEYAAQGGARMDSYQYSGGDALQEIAWYNGNSNNKSHQVGTKQPNGLGLYDMSGNVCEWCSDYYGPYPNTAQTNPTGPAAGAERVLRGGSFCYVDSHCRCAARDFYNTGGQSVGVGFRLALVQ